jgi:hypothetical protein
MINLASIPEKEIGTSGAYGDIKALASHANLNYKHLRLNGEWQHGWIPPERNVHPEFVVGSSGLSRLYRRSQTFFVARQDQVEFLKSCEYDNVEAIGHPIIYIQKSPVVRVPGSLLIMPTHSTPEGDAGRDESFYAYIEYIKSIKDRFAEVHACIHQCDIEIYSSPFNDLGINIIKGSLEEDQNSYSRMAYLGQTFEYMTTNTFGSHVAYLSYFGSRVSVTGPKPQINPLKLKNLTFYNNCDDCIQLAVELHDRLSTAYPFLVKEPWDAESNTRWAQFQLGEVNKLSKDQAKQKITHEVDTKVSYRAVLRRQRGKITRLVPRILKHSIKEIFHAKTRSENSDNILASTAFLIPTHLTNVELQTLYTYSSQLPDGSICLEIGSYLGASSVATCAGLGNGSYLYCVDTWMNHNMQYTEDEHNDYSLDIQDTFSLFLSNTSMYNNKIIPIRKWSHDAFYDLSGLGQKLNWIFIDGDHSYEGVATDWKLYSKLLAKEGLVIFHDTGWADGVNQVIYESVINSCILVDVLPNMKVFRFLGSPSWA